MGEGGLASAKAAAESCGLAEGTAPKERSKEEWSVASLAGSEKGGKGGKKLPRAKKVKTRGRRKKVVKLDDAMTFDD